MRTYAKLGLLLAALAAALISSAHTGASPGTTERVSVDSAGVQGNQPSDFGTSISADGRYVAFDSSASNLVPGDTNYTIDVFVHDRQTGATTRASVDSGGSEADAGALEAVISGDGRHVAFRSAATNLVPGDTNADADIFVHDRQTGATVRVSVDSAGVQGNQDSFGPAISGDGRFVAFESNATNLVAGDTNGKSDIFVHDRDTDEDGIFDEAGQVSTTRVSVDSGGVQGNDRSHEAAISADGRFVAFVSFATNLVAADTNGYRDVFVHDRQTGATTRVSVDTTGVEGNDESVFPAISADGRFVAFESVASNLVPGDTNGRDDIFVHDRQTGATTRVSVDSVGVEANDGSGAVTISADGRHAAFFSWASNLVPGDTNGHADTFVHDRGTESVTVEAGAGETVATDIEGNGATSWDTLETSLTTPNAGTVSIEENPITWAPGGFQILGQEVSITAPPATAADPLVIVFTLDSSQVPPGEDETTIHIFKDGAMVPPCTGPPGTASPDPCVSNRALLADNDVQITVLAATASTWNVGLPPVPVGGLAELPDVSDSPGRNYVAFAGLAAAALVALTAGGWYARRRLS
jgi:Tol biopolymer transport system component